MKIEEQKAWVSLQDLVDHIAARLVLAQADVLKSGHIQGTRLKLVSKMGFDSSTNQSIYNQLWSGVQGDDSTMVLTAVVPLLLHETMDELGM